MRIDKNISHIVEYKSMSESVADPTVYVHHSIKFSNAILEGVMHNRSALYFQAGLLIVFILFEVNLRGKSQK